MAASLPHALRAGLMSPITYHESDTTTTADLARRVRTASHEESDMNMFHRSPDPLSIRELAVDPADVDRETYPVTIRLNRPLTSQEVTALAADDGPAVRPDGDSIVVPDAKLDDVAHGHADWLRRLERAEAIAHQQQGEALLGASSEHTDFPSIGDPRGNVGMH